jgi:hypothetical protein
MKNTFRNDRHRRLEYGRVCMSIKKFSIRTKKGKLHPEFFLLIGTGKVYQPPKNGVLNSLKSLERNRSYSPPYSDIARSIGGGSVHSDCFVIARY